MNMQIRGSEDQVTTQLSGTKMKIPSHVVH